MFKSSRRLLAYAALSLVVLTALNACRDIAQPNSTTTQVAIGGGGRPYRDPSTRGDAQSYTWVINAHPIYGPVRSRRVE